MIFKNKLGLALTSATIGMAFVGCDTVANISFQEREFSSVRAAGFVPTGGDCSAMTQGEGALRFVLLADDQTAIRPLEPVARTTFTPSLEAFTFSDTTLFETPNISCSDDSDCRVSGFECLDDPTIGSNRCGNTQADLTLVNVPEFESDVSNSQLLAVVVEGSGSLGGFLPESVVEANPGVSAFLGDRASDRQERRSTALSAMILNYGAVREAAAKEGRQSLFGMWEFSGSSTAGVRSLTDQFTPTDGSVFSDSPNIVDQSNNLSEVTGTRANVYQAIDSVLDSMEDAQYNGFDKMMVVFVDGPDDLRLSAFNAGAAASRASDLGVRIFIVHLDQSQGETLDADELQNIFPDDPDYWRGGRQDACADDSGCKNFESCRAPQANGGADPNANGDSYCMVNRTSEGQVGPIDEYAEIACETGGAYIYVNDERSISYNMEWLPYALDGLWKANITLDAFENETVEMDEFYYIETQFSATVGGTNRVIDIARAGRSTPVEEAQDTRAIVNY